MEDCASCVVVDFFFFFVDDDDDEEEDVVDGFFFFFFLLPPLDGFFAASIHIVISMYIVCMVSERVEKLVSVFYRMCTSCEHFLIVHSLHSIPSSPKSLQQSTTN